MMYRLAPLLLGLIFGAAGAMADTALIAVATNFAPVAEALAPGFAAATGHQIEVTSGATGKLYAQITEAAPFDVLLSADVETPARLGAEGLGDPASQFTYAVGQLVLWSADPALIGPDASDALQSDSLRFVAIANPDLAPYGVAAREVLQHLGLWDSLQPKIVMGQNIGQTFALVDSGAAELGFVALSALTGTDAGGSQWIVPPQLHNPLQQDAILLAHGADNPAAQAFLDYLKTPQARALIAASGYAVGP
jgi:molybdate transport system substrate-binding protein